MPDLKSGLLNRCLLPLLGWLALLAAPVLIYEWMRDLLLNVPFMDDYVWLHIYEKIHDGTFKWWDDIFFVQMEHRLTVPAFLASLFCYLKPGQITLHNWCSFAQLCLTGVNVLILLKQTLPELRHRLFIGVVAIWILFSPVQACTLLWADCFSSYMGPYFLSLTLVLFQSRLPDWAKLPLCLVSTILGSLSLACGLNIWIVMAVLMAGTGRLAGMRRWAWLALWLGAFAITLVLYFRNMTNQAEPEFSYSQGNEVTLGKHVEAVLAQPAQAARFVLVFVGSMLGRGTFSSLEEASFWAGLALVTALAGFAVLAIVKRKDGVSLTATLPWLVFGLYSIGTGSMVALGRIYSRNSLLAALWNRYTIHNMPIVIAVLVLGCYWWQRLLAGSDASDWRGKIRPAGPVLLGAFASLVVVGWIYGQNFMDSWWSSRLRDATCQMFGDMPGKFQGWQPLTKNIQYAVRMDKIGLLHPAMVKSDRLDQFPLLAEKPLSDGSAKIESFEKGVGSKFVMEGTAYIHGQSRPADGIILAWKNAEGAWTMFALGQSMSFPRYLRDTLGPDLQYLYQPTQSLRHNFAGFEIVFDKAQLPAGDVEVGVWAFDFKRQGLYAISGRFKVNGEKGTVDTIEEAPPSKQ